jgi:hypothetical protein
MSKLYVKVATDRITKKVTATGNKWLNGYIYWDSASDPKIALGFEVKWDGKEAEPLVFVNGKRFKVFEK